MNENHNLMNEEAIRDVATIISPPGKYDDIVMLLKRLVRSDDPVVIMEEIAEEVGLDSKKIYKIMKDVIFEYL